MTIALAATRTWGMRAVILPDARAERPTSPWADVIRCVALGAELVGYIEVDSREDAGRLPRFGGWADIGNLYVVERHRRHGVGTWLVGQAAEWLELARLDRVLDYASPDQPDYEAFLRNVGFRELTRTERGWRRCRRQG